jgi:hypothetical protein
MAAEEAVFIIMHEGAHARAPVHHEGAESEFSTPLN